MDVNGEKVEVAARERGQRTHIKGVFDNVEAGIFFKVSDANFRDAESKLVRAFL